MKKDKSDRLFRIGAPILSLCLAPIFASALVVRHDRDAALFVKLARDFPSTAMLRHGDGTNGLGGEGTLIDSRWVLTAAHVATDLGPGDPVTILEKAYKIERVVIYPACVKKPTCPSTSR